MADINQVILVGRLTRDSELRYTASGMGICKFSLALNRRVKKGDEWIEEVSYFDVTLWGKQGEALSKYLLKGKQVGVQGELRQNRWEQDGQKRSKVEINANNIQLLGGNVEGGASRHQTGGGASLPKANNVSDVGDYNAFEDDIPF